jgi:glycosyltransferase involved in cell wall biosynthesis
VDRPLRVSIVLPVHNAAPYLRAAVESLLAQTVHDFEMIVVDDGSTDDTPAILRDLQARDDRLLVHPIVRAGQSAALNQGIALARSPYVAIAHADDVYTPDRLQRQVEYMDDNPEIALCGAAARAMRDGKREVWRYPAAHDDIRCHLLFECAVAHPTVIMRRTAFQDRGLRYDQSLPSAQDYELWVRAVQSLRFANLPHVLVAYRLHKQQVRHVDPSRAARISSIRKQQLARLGVRATDDELAIHNAIGDWDFEPSRDFVARAGSWLLRLHEANRRSGVYPEERFATMLSAKLYLTCAQAARQGPWAWSRLETSPFAKYRPRGQRVKLLVRSLARDFPRRAKLPAMNAPDARDE